MKWNKTINKLFQLVMTTSSMLLVEDEWMEIFAAIFLGAFCLGTFAFARPAWIMFKVREENGKMIKGERLSEAKREK